MIKQIPLLLIPFLFACGGDNETPTTTDTVSISTIIPPLEGDFSNNTVFTIDPTVENKLETPNGSNFTVPANAIVDVNGEPVTDEIEIEFNQFHSPVDILASGIPMDYDSLGQSYDFKSAGMFSLNGTCNDAPVFVKDGKSIAMNLASDKNTDEPFNFYTLDEESRDWTYEHSNSPVSGNPRFDPANYTPIEPEPVSENAFILDISFDLSNYNELEAFSGIVWEYTGSEDSLDPRKNNWVSSTRWTDFDLEPTYDKAYEYYMTMKNKKKSFTTKVKAALDGTDLDLAMANFTQKKIEVAKKIDDLQKPFIRSVNISGFGTYNYDYIHSVEEPAQMMADFDFGKFNDLKSKAMVAVVYEGENMVVNFPEDKWDSFGLDTKANPKLIAILPDNRIAIYRKNISKCFDKKEFTFNMDVLDKTVENKNDLIDILASY